LANGSVVTNVRWLELRANGITDQGAVALAESPHLGNVQRLNLTDNRIGPRGREALARRFGDRAEV
jgi:hypothetical protein